MDRPGWVTTFSIALQELRPHLSGKVANLIGLQQYRSDVEPEAAALAYHTSHGGEPPVPARKRKRP